MAEVSTAETKEIPTIPAPDLPPTESKPQTTTTIDTTSSTSATTKGGGGDVESEQAPSGYSAVSKSSQSVASVRYNPLTPAKKPLDIVETVTVPIATTEEEEKVSEPKQTQAQQPAPKANATAIPQPQQPARRYNQYPMWPIREQAQYLTFHPFGWPIDPEYQYQISNYLGPTPVQNMAQNMAMAQLRAMNPMMNAVPGVNPMSTMLAAQAAFNPAAAAAAVGVGAGMGMGNMNAGGLPTGKQCSLFVFHLPVDIDDHGLLQLFVPFGAMGSNVMRHDSGQSRGFGFVHFNSKHEAQIAIDMMDGHQIGRKRLRVSFKKDDAK